MVPVINTEMMNHHLQAISRQVQPGHHAVVILDGAPWHRAGGRIKVPDNISLLTLPPYAPELNPVENVWQYLRQNYLSNRVFETYDDILQACCNAWNAFADIPGKITQIAERSWAQVKI